MSGHATLRGAVARFRDAWSALGPVGLASAVPVWLMRRQYLAAVKDLRDPLPPIPVIRGLTWRPLARAEIPRLIAGNPTLSAAEVGRRLSEGQECWVGWLGATAVHWRWETRREAYLPYLHRHALPLCGDLWTVEVYTHPSQRGRGLYAAGTVMAMQRGREEGDLRVIGLIAGWNRPARRVAEEKLQRRIVGSVGYWGVGRWHYPFVTGDVVVDGEGRVLIPRRQEPQAAHLDARGDLSASGWG
jgi:hypothetical protein